MTTAKFLSFEGIDGAGKSSQIPYIAELLRKQGYEVVVTREPGGTELVERLRNLLLEQNMNSDTQLLLMFAARLEHVDRVIMPALAQGKTVICDRFTDSSYAYQGGGHSILPDKITLLEKTFLGDFEPHRTYLFDAPIQLCLSRLSDKSKDVFEQNGISFFTRVRNAYLQRAQQYPTRIATIDATQTIEVIQENIRKDLRSVYANPNI